MVNRFPVIEESSDGRAEESGLQTVCGNVVMYAENGSAMPCGFDGRVRLLAR